MDIPKNKDFPDGAVQCGGCRGEGCGICDYNGWLTPKNHPDGRRCRNPRCGKPLPPNHNPNAGYCDNYCAHADAILEDMRL